MCYKIQNPAILGYRLITSMFLIDMTGQIVPVLCVVNPCTKAVTKNPPNKNWQQQKTVLRVGQGVVMDYEQNKTTAQSNSYKTPQ